MNISEIMQERFEKFSEALEFSPNRDRAVYQCVHGGLIFVAAVFVLAGFAAAVWPAIVLSLALTARDPWQVQLSRRFSLAVLIVLGVYVVGLIAALPFSGAVGAFKSLSSVLALVLAVGAQILWLWSAERLFDAQFRRPPEDSGPW